MDGWFDPVEYGELLKDLRGKRPRKRQQDMVRDCNDLGVKMSMRRYGTIERGERVARVDEHMAFEWLLAADPDYFFGATRR